MESTRTKISQPKVRRGHSRLIRARDTFLNFLFNIPQNEILNPAVQGIVPVRLDPKVPGQEVLKSILQFKGAAFSQSGSQVDYAVLARSPAFSYYKTRVAPALKDIDPAFLTNFEHKLAFWTNLYNAMIIDAVLTFRIKKSVTEKRGIIRFFRRAAYNIGGRRISAEEIEHGILRANRGHPYFPGAQFADDDPRTSWVLPRLEPRIHFALNCASVSCPPIGTYSPDRTLQQMEIAAHNFIEGETVILPDKNEVRTSRIFQWYAEDFGGRDGTLRFLLRYLPESDERAWLAAKQESVRLRFKAYNWRLNN